MMSFNPVTMLREKSCRTTKRRLPVLELAENNRVARHFDNINSLPEIDRLVYALYGLTEDEIAVVEGKQ